MATAIVRRPLVELIQASRPKFEGRLPAGMTVDRFMYGLATACQKNPELAKCDPQSVILAAYEAAEIGCNLSPSLSQGWLIPYGGVAQFQPGYRFFIQKAYDTKAISALYAEVVYENDHFRREFAPKRTLHHLPPTDGASRGEPIGAYAMVEFKDGHFDWEYLTKEQIDRHRNASKQPNSMMWTKFWEEGWRKTPIRMLWKRLPLSNPGLESLAEIIEKDAERDADPITPGRLDVEEPPAQTPALAPTGATILHFFVGPKQTVITGATEKLDLKEMKKLGLKVENRQFVIPSGMTEAFLNLYDKPGFSLIEVDEKGQEVKPWEDAPAAPLFEDEPSQA